MIAVFAAMQPEMHACTGCFGVRRATSIAGYPAIDGEFALVCQTGMGRRAEECMAAVLPQLSPKAVISIGIAGGLHSDGFAGEIILCRQVDHAQARGAASAGPSVSADHGLLAAALRTAEELRLPARVGSSVTVDSPAWTPEGKADLHGWLQHDIVEMESYWVGKAAAERGLPFLAVRVIADQANDELVQSGAMKDDGSFDQAAFGAFISEHPELMPVVSRQMECSRLALAALTQFANAFLPRLAELAAGRAA